MATSQIGLVGLAVMGQVRRRGLTDRFCSSRSFLPATVLALPAPPCCACPHTQNLALNIADKGFPISVFNRSYEKTEAAVKRAQKEGALQPER
jgi:6-phosphogluconate dehydrogenase